MSLNPTVFYSVYIYAWLTFDIPLACLVMWFRFNPGIPWCRLQGQGPQRPGGRHWWVPWPGDGFATRRVGSINKDRAPQECSLSSKRCVFLVRIAWWPFYCQERLMWWCRIDSRMLNSENRRRGRFPWFLMARRTWVKRRTTGGMGGLNYSALGGRRLGWVGQASWRGMVVGSSERHLHEWVGLGLFHCLRGSLYERSWL